MNIDYAAIIENANKRKDSLLRFQAAANGLHEQLMASRALTEALGEFYLAYNALDQEAHKLLPENAGHSVAQFTTQLMTYWRAFDQRGNYQMTPREGLALLVDKP